MRISLGEHLVATKKQILLEAYQKYLTEGYEWTLFFNITFRYATSYERARKRFKWFFKYLNTEHKRYFRNYVKCWVFYERQSTSRGGVHIHAFIDRIKPEYSKTIQKEARRLFGEISVVEPYDSSRGAAYYLAKKIGTDSLVNYEFYVINSKVRR